MTMMYVDDHQGHIPELTYFFQADGLPFRCPSVTPHWVNITRGGFSWNVGDVGVSRTIAQIRSDEWCVKDRIPWHDANRKLLKNTGTKQWRGFHNTLYWDGRLKWENGLSPWEFDP